MIAPCVLGTADLTVLNLSRLVVMLFLKPDVIYFMVY